MTEFFGVFVGPEFFGVFVGQYGTCFVSSFLYVEFSGGLQWSISSL